MSRLATAGRFLRQNPGVTLALLLNVVLLFLPFYDSNNIPLAISFVSHFQNHSGVLSVGNWVGGPFVGSVWTPIYLGYLLSGFSIYAAYTVSKAVDLLLLIVLAVTLVSHLPPTETRQRNAVLIFTLANPIWLYVNYIWTEWDIFPVLFLALGYVILRYGGDRPKSRVHLLSAAMIVVGVFFYWFPLAVIPTLLYYSKNLEERVKTFLALLVTAGVMVVVLVFLLGASLGTYSSTLASTSSVLNRSGSFGFQYFAHMNTVGYVLLTLGIVLLLPLLLQKWRVSEPATMFVVLTLLVYTSFVPMPDNYTFAFPFAVLALVTPGLQRVPWRRLWVSIAYPLTGLILVNFFISNGQPDGVGIFFFGYDIFGNNVRFLTTQSATNTFLVAFNVITTIAVLAAILTVVLSSRGDRSPADSRPRRSPSLPAGRRKPRAWRQRAIKGAVIFAVLMAGALAFNVLLPNAIQYNGSGNPPLYTILPLFIPDNGNVIRPIPNETFTESGNRVNIAENALPFQFSRWFEGQGVTFSAEESLGGKIPQMTPVLTGSPFNVTFYNYTGPDVTGLSPLTGNFSTNLTEAPATLPIPIQGYNGTVMRFHGNTSVDYNFTQAEFLNRYLTFGYQLSAPNPNGTNLLHLDTPQGFFAVVQYPSQLLAVTGGPATGMTYSKFLLENNTTINATSYLSLQAGPSSVWLEIAGHDIRVPVDLFAGAPLSLRLGVPFEPNGTGFALRGATTPLYLSAQNFSLVPQYFAEVGNTTTPSRLSDSSISFSLHSDSAGTALTVEGRSYQSARPTSVLSVGKFVSGSYTVEIAFHQFSVTQYSSDRFTLVPEFFVVLAPNGLLVIGVQFLRRRQGPRALSSAQPPPPVTPPSPVTKEPVKPAEW